jgi:hypothetical protein
LLERAWREVAHAVDLVTLEQRRDAVTIVRARQVIDLWYSGKAHTYGGNLQAVLAPDGFPLWVSPVEPGSVHDITAGRTHALPALYHAAADLPTLADLGYDGAALASTSRSNSAQTGGNSISIPAPAMLSSARCGAWANAGSPCSPAAGAPYSTSPPALAKSAASPAPRSSSPISSIATSHEIQ